MKLNFFNEASPLFPIRWFVVAFIGMAALMIWHDISGGRLFAPSAQQWSSSGPGYHK